MVRIKICGITNEEDAEFTAHCGADAIGLNFYSRSPRFISNEQAERVIRGLPGFIAPVGVFVDTSVDEIKNTAMQHALRAVQTYSLNIPGGSFFPVAHIPAFRIQDARDLTQIHDYILKTQKTGNRLAAVLVDSFVAGEMGGTGVQAPWEILKGFDPGIPLILAGGLTPENVANAIQVVKPWGVDVASGVESSSGKKDRGKIRAFIQAARSVVASS